MDASSSARAGREGRPAERLPRSFGRRDTHKYGKRYRTSPGSPTEQGIIQRLPRGSAGSAGSFDSNVCARVMIQGLAFTLKERLSLGIHGLQPPRFKTQEEQLALCKASVMKYTEDLNRYLYLVELQVKLETAVSTAVVIRLL